MFHFSDKDNNIVVNTFRNRFNHLQLPEEYIMLYGIVYKLAPVPFSR